MNLTYQSRYYIWYNFWSVLWEGQNLLEHSFVQFLMYFHIYFIWTKISSPYIEVGMIYVFSMCIQVQGSNASFDLHGISQTLDCKLFFLLLLFCYNSVLNFFSVLDLYMLKCTSLSTFGSIKSLRCNSMLELLCLVLQTFISINTLFWGLIYNVLDS